jgi:hypothetical protein
MVDDAGSAPDPQGADEPRRTYSLAEVMTENGFTQAEIDAVPDEPGDDEWERMQAEAYEHWRSQQ